MFYNFLETKETHFNPNIIKELEQNFSFLSPLQNKNENSNFCSTCFSDFHVSYNITNLPDVLLLSVKNEKNTLPILLEESVDLSSFISFNHKSNIFEYST